MRGDQFLGLNHLRVYEDAPAEPLQTRSVHQSPLSQNRAKSEQVYITLPRTAHAPRRVTPLVSHIRRPLIGPRRGDVKISLSRLCGVDEKSFASTSEGF